MRPKKIGYASYKWQAGVHRKNKLPDFVSKFMAEL